MKNTTWVLAASLALAGCDSANEKDASQKDSATAEKAAATIVAAPHATTAVKTSAAAVSKSVSDNKELQTILDAQESSVQARYDARHPKQTIEFFGIQPGMTVVEALPGGGWYSKILMPYLGKNGTLIGADYAADMFQHFGFFTPEQLQEKNTWVASWTKQANGWRSDDWSEVKAFQFGGLKPEMEGTADAVLFIRALHNLARFEDKGGYLTTALDNTFKILKPGGVVGIVQHQAPESASDEWASGANGYLKKSFVVDVMGRAGFKLVGESAVNENALDQPTDKDFVWRLPPTYAGSRDNPEQKSKYEMIGESNRMTLKFIKPAKQQGEKKWAS